MACIALCLNSQSKSDSFFITCGHFGFCSDLEMFTDRRGAQRRVDLSSLLFIDLTAAAILTEVVL